MGIIFHHIHHTQLARRVDHMAAFRKEVDGVTDPQLQDIASSIARLETFQAELMSKDTALHRMKRENEALLEESAKAAQLESRLQSYETKYKHLESEKEMMEQANAQKQVELLHVLSAHREYEKKLLSEIDKLEKMSLTKTKETEFTLSSLERKVHESETYAVRLESERRTISTELERVIRGAREVELSKEESRKNCEQLEGQVRALQTR